MSVNVLPPNRSTVLTDESVSRLYTEGGRGKPAWAVIAQCGGVPTVCCARVHVKPRTIAAARGVLVCDADSSEERRMG